MASQAHDFSSDLSGYNERQFVHALGQQFGAALPGAGLWYEQRLYVPGNGSSSGWLSKKKADIHIVEKRQELIDGAPIGHGYDYAWLELKYTGLTPDVRGNSVWGVWEDDLDELADLKVRAPKISRCDFVWCHLIETHARQVKKIAPHDAWSGPMEPRKMGQKFGNVDPEVNGTIASCLAEVSRVAAKLAEGTVAQASLMPRLPRVKGWGTSKQYSVILVTVTIP